eukprot:3011078-Rhodomonas_salina.1
MYVRIPHTAISSITITNWSGSESRWMKCHYPGDPPAGMGMYPGRARIPWAGSHPPRLLPRPAAAIAPPVATDQRLDLRLLRLSTLSSGSGLESLSLANLTRT